KWGERPNLRFRLFALPGYKLSSPIPSALEIKHFCLLFKDTSLGEGLQDRNPGFTSFHPGYLLSLDKNYGFL
ncbi:hypothetical protein, partial [Legionella sp. 28fT52]|uniref:hypothetical protein n=1 Tax=Legionella sp. 28fT52 TaxID=3410134 RepID=UPI003AF99068